MKGVFGPMPVSVMSLVWLGLLLGVSFLATPIKFAAPSLEMPVALDVGRQTFALLNRVEIGLGSILAVLVLCGLRRPAAVISLGLLLGLIGAQSIWLLPALDERVELIMQGVTPLPSLLHSSYVVVEILKVAVLIILAIVSVRNSSLTEHRSSDSLP